MNRREAQTARTEQRIEQRANDEVPCLGQPQCRNGERTRQRCRQPHVHAREQCKHDAPQDRARNRRNQRQQLVNDTTYAGDRAVGESPRTVPRVRRVRFGEDVLERQLDVLVDQVFVTVVHVQTDTHVGLVFARLVGAGRIAALLTL